MGAMEVLYSGEREGQFQLYYISEVENGRLTDCGGEPNTVARPPAGQSLRRRAGMPRIARDWRWL